MYYVYYKMDTKNHTKEHIKERLELQKSISYRMLSISNIHEYIMGHAYFYKKFPNELPDNRLKECVKFSLSRLYEPDFDIPYKEEKKIAMYFFNKQLRNMHKGVTHLVLDVGYEERLRNVKTINWERSSKDKITNILYQLYRRNYSLSKYGSSGVITKIKSEDTFFDEYLKFFEKIEKQNHCGCLYILPYRVHIVTFEGKKILICYFDTESG